MLIKEHLISLTLFWWNIDKEYQIPLTLLCWNIDKGTPNTPDFIMVEY
jgi:hypothetical protein